MKSILVFGVFDELHPGHEDFLRQARALGDRLIVCVAQDDVVEALKGKRPSQPLADRMNALDDLEDVNTTVAGDTVLGSYSVLQNLDPDVIALGYDQTLLKEDLERWMQNRGESTPLVTLEAFQPERYKSSLRRNV